MALPEIGTRVLAYLPNLRRQVPLRVTAHRATKFWGIDDGGSRWAGLSKWQPLADDLTGDDVENSTLLGDGDDLTGDDVENSTLLGDGDDLTDDDVADVENSTLLGDGDDLTDDDVADVENSTLLGDGDDLTDDDVADVENSTPLGDGDDLTGDDVENSTPLGDDLTGDDVENSTLLGDGDDLTDDDVENSPPLDDEDEDLTLRPSPNIVRVPINRITECPELFQPRQYLDDLAIERYIAMLSYSEPPPVELWLAGGGLLFLIHGHHRLAAARRAGRRTIPAIIKSGTKAEAVKAALTANLSNGLPLNRSAIENACKRYIQLDSDMSDRQLAKIFGLDPKTVGNYRRDLVFAATIADWVETKTRVVLDGYTHTDRYLYLGTYRGRAYGADNRWSVLVDFDYQRVNRNGIYPVSRLLRVDDPVPDKPDFHLGDRCWHPEYGYGFIFYDPPADRDSLRQLGLVRGVGWQVCFFPEWSGRIASVPSSSLEFVAAGQGLGLVSLDSGLSLGAILLSLREAIAQIPDDMPSAEADRLHGYLNARIEWVKSLVVASAAFPDNPRDDVDDGADDAYLPTVDDDVDDGTDDDYLPAADDDDADGGVDDLDDQLALFLDFLPTFLVEADRTNLYRLLCDSAAELRRRGISNTVLIQCIRSDSFHPLAG